MTGIDLNVWLPAATGLLGAFIGAVSSFIPVIIIESSKAKREAANLKAALVSEIKAIVDIAEARNYLKSLLEVCTHLESEPQGVKFAFLVGVPDHYARIYKTNCGRIGEIDFETAVAVVTFHQFVDAIVQDVRPGGVLANGAEAVAFKEVADILGRAIEIGKKLSVRT